MFGLYFFSEERKQNEHNRMRLASKYSCPFVPLQSKWRSRRRIDQWLVTVDKPYEILHADRAVCDKDDSRLPPIYRKLCDFIGGSLSSCFLFYHQLRQRSDRGYAVVSSRILPSQSRRQYFYSAPLLISITISVFSFSFFDQEHTSHSRRKRI